MASESLDARDNESCRRLMKQLAGNDGKLISPIDLSLEATAPLDLAPLHWVNVDEVPARMRLTNTGDTVIVSAKWAHHRPHLTGGPLDSNYVFSQVHFHWGATEHEGSEHTVRGISYPMEVHAVFFKTRYLTQEAALKHDDGLVIVVYLVKLADRSTPGLEWLCEHLPRVTQPQTSTKLDPLPISALLVPFPQDYLLYWGAVATQRCSHTMTWLVSRSALAITSDHLTKFRSLLNSNKERMVKNFRGAGPTLGRSIFHVSPEKTEPSNKHVLLPGTVDPPGLELVVVQSSTVPELRPSQAAEVFSRGDSSDGVVQGKKELDSKIIEDQFKLNINELGKNLENINELGQNLDNINTPRNIKSGNDHTKGLAEREEQNPESENVNIQEKFEKVRMRQKDQAMARNLLELERKEMPSARISKPPTPFCPGFSAATTKRLQERMAGSRGESRRKEVLVHPAQLGRTSPVTKEPQGKTPARTKMSATRRGTSQPIQSSLAEYFSPPSPPSPLPRRVLESKIPKPTRSPARPAGRPATRRNVKVSN